MKTTWTGRLLALALACPCAALALPLPLEGAAISATYNGSADGMLGLDHLFAAGPGTNTSTLDPTGSGVEFLTSDFLFGIDFGADGSVTILANEAVAPGAYSMRFDFGNSLAKPIHGFTLTASDGVTGVPGLTVIDDHTIALDLGGMDWSQFASLTATIDASAVPEPASIALLLAGLAGMAALRRRT